MHPQDRHALAAGTAALVMALLAVTVSAVEILEASGSAAQHKFDAAAKQQTLDEKAQPKFYYRPVSATDTKSTASTQLSSGTDWLSSGSNRPSSGPPSSGFSSGLSSGSASSGAFSSGLSSGSGSSSSGGFSSGLSSASSSSRGFSSGLTSGSSSKGDFSSGLSSSPSSDGSFSSGLSTSSSSIGSFSSGSGAVFPSIHPFDTRTVRLSGDDGFSSGVSGSPKASFPSESPPSSSGFLSGFFPSVSPFGSSDTSPFRSTSPSFTDDADHGKAFADFGASFGGHDDEDDSSPRPRVRVPTSAEDVDEATEAEAEAPDGDSGGRYERGYMHTRDFRDTKAVATPSMTRPRTLRTRSSRYKRKRPYTAESKHSAKKSPLRNFDEQKYREPYTENRANNTDYKYYEDHGGNDTYREHHYRHVVSYHHYYNGSDNTSTAAPYSKDAAYASLQQAKKYNYNVDHVYKDGRYIPIVHKQPANLSEGDFPDGPHVKHHYYNNEYVHDHRNKSEGPVVRHHYHDKDVKVFYHDHRNKSSGDSTYSSYNPSTYSTYSPSKYSTHSPSEYSTTTSADEGTSSEGYSSSSSSEKPVVKHHHHFKEYHYDESGRPVDPRKYNYTNKYSNSQADEESDGDSGGGSYATEESRGNYSEQESAADSGRGEDGDDVLDEEDATPTTRSYYYNSNHENHYSNSGHRPRFESEPEFTTPPPNSHARRPKSHRGAVGYQLHYRDFGDHSFASKEVNFDDGFSFHKERRAGPSSYLESYSSSSPGAGGSGYFSRFRAAAPANDEDAPRYKGGYRSTLVTRDVEGKRHGGAPPLGGLGQARVYADHTRSLVSRGNIGYILVDPLGELPTIRIHASLVNSQQTAHSAPFPRYAPAPSLPPSLPPSLAPSLAPTTPSRGFLFGDPFHSGGPSATALRRIDAVAPKTTASSSLAPSAAPSAAPSSRAVSGGVANAVPSAPQAAPKSS